MQFRAINLITLVVWAAVAISGKTHHNDEDNIRYKFGYAVHDPHTGDIKSHHEERHGKNLVGYYTLKQPDGTTRIVHYKAGPHIGFKASVQIIGHPHHFTHNKNNRNHESHKGNHQDHRSHGRFQSHDDDTIHENYEDSDDPKLITNAFYNFEDDI